MLTEPNIPGSMWIQADLQDAESYVYIVVGVTIAGLYHLSMGGVPWPLKPQSWATSRIATDL